MFFFLSYSKRFLILFDYLKLTEDKKLKKPYKEKKTVQLCDKYYLNLIHTSKLFFCVLQNFFFIDFGSKQILPFKSSNCNLLLSNLVMH